MLRPELIRTREGDELILYDPLLERLHRLPAETLDPPSPERLAWLAERLLLDGPAAERLRAEVVRARLARPPLPEPFPEVPATDWRLAEDLPDGVSSRWREGEAWRRIAEERAAGRRVSILRGFLAPTFCEVLRMEAAALHRERLDTDRVHAERSTSASSLPRLREILRSADTRTLVGAVLGVALPDALHLNVWRLQAGDHFAVHPDGSRYRATFALGLNPGWNADHGGAIAFGTPQADGGFAVQERWLPHLGDLCLFVPGPCTWHVVEAPSRERWTASGWWLDESATGDRT